MKSKEEYISNRLGNNEDYETYNSMFVEDYLSNFLNNEDNDNETKMVVFNFLKKHMYQGLYAVEGIRKGLFFILLEDEDDKVLDKVFIGHVTECEKETWDDYSLLTMPMRVEDELRLTAILDNTNDEEKLERFKTLGKFLGLDKYICSAIDNDAEESTVILISDKEGNIIEKINY